MINAVRECWQTQRLYRREGLVEAAGGATPVDQGTRGNVKGLLLNRVFFYERVTKEKPTTCRAAMVAQKQDVPQAVTAARAQRRRPPGSQHAPQSTREDSDVTTPCSPTTIPPASCGDALGGRPARLDTTSTGAHPQATGMAVTR
ncbi:unnamed protein product [Boreogadus saida]